MVRHNYTLTNNYRPMSISSAPYTSKEFVNNLDFLSKLLYMIECLSNLFADLRNIKLSYLNDEFIKPDLLSQKHIITLHEYYNIILNYKKELKKQGIDY